jgi:hypothetical protein
MTRPVDVESQASGDLTRPNPRLHPESEHSRPSFGSSSFYNRGPEPQFNSPRGIQNINTGSGNQFPRATFIGPVHFSKNLPTLVFEVC